MNEETKKMFTISSGIVAILLVLGVFFTILQLPKKKTLELELRAVPQAVNGPVSPSVRETKQTVQVEDTNVVKATVEVKK